MRTTFNANSDALISQFNLLSSRMNQLQTEAATGLRIQNPEDDPGGMEQVLHFQAQAKAATQYQTNIAGLQTTATAAGSAMQGLQTISSRLDEIATLADGTKSAADLQSYATEVTQLIQQAAQTANTKNGDNYLFGGTATNQAPFKVATDTNGNVTGVTYQGNTSQAAVEIANGATVTATVPGANTTGTGPQGLLADSRTGADFFAHAIALQNDLLAGNTTAIQSTDSPALTKDDQQLLSQVAANGALQSRLDTASTLVQNQITNLDTANSNVTNADLTDTITKLSQARTAYQAALQTGGSLLQISLLNYLK